MFKVIETDTYQKEISKLTKNYTDEAKKISAKFTLNPFVGKILSYNFLREKRIREKRIYYLIYEDLNLVLLVGISGKKDQQRVIDFIKFNLENFRKLAEEVSKQLS